MSFVWSETDRERELRESRELGEARKRRRDDDNDDTEDEDEEK